ncbi:MAG: hypothetical protein IKS22_07305 [Bacteroidales bacterium]|nr:hypothetical protein [Bacteroidales bacterium]
MDAKIDLLGEESRCCYDAESIDSFLGGTLADESIICTDKKGAFLELAQKEGLKLNPSDRWRNFRRTYLFRSINRYL